MSATTLARLAPAARYPAALRALHWLMAALILAMFVMGVWMRYFEPKDPVFDHRLYNLHESTGVTIWILVWLRAAVRLGGGAPRLPDDTPAGVRLAAALNHAGLYLMLFLMPILGLLNANAWGVQLHWYEAVPVPVLIAKRPDAVAYQFSYAHWWGAATLLVLLILHLAGAAYHGLVRRDGVVRRMA